MDPLNVKTTKIVRRKAVVKVPENIAPLKSLGGYHHFCRLTSSSLEVANPQVVVSLHLYFFVFLPPYHCDFVLIYFVSTGDGFC
jgi:hypothetical protein